MDQQALTFPAQIPTTANLDRTGNSPQAILPFPRDRKSFSFTQPRVANIVQPKGDGKREAEHCFVDWFFGHGLHIFIDTILSRFLRLLHHIESLHFKPSPRAYPTRYAPITKHRLAPTSAEPSTTQSRWRPDPGQQPASTILWPR